MLFPKFDGRTVLTKEVMNEVVRLTNANEKLTVSPGLDVLNLGSLGKHVSISSDAVAGATTITSTAYSGAGFWARLYIAPEGDPPANVPEGDPPTAAPYLYFVEQIVGTVPATSQEPAGVGPIDNPDGRKGFFNKFNVLFQHFANLGFASPNTAICMALANWVSGTFTVTVHVSTNGSDLTTADIDWPPTAASVKAALDALGATNVDEWSVTLVASGTTPPDENSVTGTGIAFNVEAVSDTAVLQSLALDTTDLVSVVGGVSTVGNSYASEPRNTRMVNVNPHGQLVFVQSALGADGNTYYLYDLPYVGMWARITGAAADGSDPPQYPFIEQQVGSGLGNSIDYVDGTTGYAFEVNGEPGVPKNVIVWLIPLFIASVGFIYVFQAPNDMRLLRYTGGDAAPNCAIMNPTQGVGSQGHMIRPDRSTGTYLTDGYYLGQRSGSTNGYPTFLVPETLGNSSGWSGSFANQSGTVTVTNGRITDFS